MKELKEIQFSNDTIVLDTNLVRGAILPKSLSEMDRDVIFRKDTLLPGLNCTSTATPKAM